ncbi:hypothetical protein B7988_04975 [Fibrobacter sp. UWB1]|uniref:TIGR02147 family protein n=1 Tax=Fibrobacter sp. UWB1 TaxID=1964355 RepID=UPI000B52359F|nr:TIGR02147 family protein [Fibrobacter sp. UWB1]OWV26519.1 hypothetical protein B7988_04975 [Fibrobacter sp. UWB1]
MAPILQYQDFRRYLQDFYDWKKRTSVFSWRDYSKMAGFASPVFMKQVCEGKANLGKKATVKVADAFNFIGIEREYFFSLVMFAQAKTDDKKRFAYAEMQSIAKASKVNLIGVDAYKYYDSWVHPVVRELAPAMPGAMPKEIAGKCVHEVSAKEVRDSINFQVRAGILKKTDDGNYSQTDKLLGGDTQSMSLAVRSMNRQMATFAVDALDRFAADERYVAGVTMGVSDGAFEKIVETLKRCRNQVLEIIANDDKVDRVLRLNLQLFPLTQKIEGADDEK